MKALMAFAAVLLFTAVPCFFLVLMAGERAEANKPINLRAWELAQESVNAKLIDADGGDFGEWNEKTAVEGFPNLEGYRVDAEVVSRNAAGVSIRQPFLCLIRHHLRGGDLSVIGVYVGEEEYARGQQYFAEHPETQISQ